MTDERELLKRVAEALREIRLPEAEHDIVSSGRVHGLAGTGPGRFEFALQLAAGEPESIAREARRVAESVEGVESVEVRVERPPDARSSGKRKLPVLGQEPTRGRSGGRPGAAPGPGPGPGMAPPQPQELAGVEHVIAVSSGKGGVGKSTVATNIAVALARGGARVGLLDADVYGPDIPTMLGTHEKPRVTSQERVVPIEAHGVRFMSIGLLLGEDTPAIWRGPIVMGIIRQFLQQVDWGDLDYLVVDMPPGTGDAQLSLVQLVKVEGAVMVTTPQGVSTADVLKGIKMFERVDVPVLGLVENMSGFVCPHCGDRTDIFGRGGGRQLAATAGVDFLGEVPLGSSIVRAGDSGRPTVIGDPDSPEGKALLEVAERIAAALAVSKTGAETPTS